MVAEELERGKDSAEACSMRGPGPGEIVRALNEMGTLDLPNVETWEAAR